MILEVSLCHSSLWACYQGANTHAPNAWPLTHTLCDPYMHLTYGALTHIVCLSLYLHILWGCEERRVSPLIRVSFGSSFLFF